VTCARQRVALGVLTLALSCTSCKKKTQPAPQPVASARAEPSATAAPKPKPWYAGRWSGSYRAERDVIDMTVKQGAIPEWDKDSGRRASGPGTLNLDVDDHGKITGTLRGPLGELLARGAVEGDELRVKLSAKDPQPLSAFNGDLVATRAGEGAKGHLHVSTGDSLTVRRGPVLLQKGAVTPPAPPASAPAASSRVAARGGATSK
jgi:hypothetical protein